MLIQRIGHPESTSLKGVEEGADSGNVSCLFCPKNQADGSKNGQFELRGFSPSSRIVQNGVGIVEFGGTGNDLSFSRIYSPAQQTYQHLFRCRSHVDALRCIAVFVAHCGWDANIAIKRPE